MPLTRRQPNFSLSQPAREAILGNSNAAPSAAAIQDAKRGTKGGKKRHKRCPYWVVAVAYDDDDNDKKADGSGMGCVTTAVHSGKRQARPLTDHFKRLFEEACPNHV
jgi:hypothetical protein